MNQAKKLIYDAPSCKTIHLQPGQIIAASPYATIILFSLLEGGNTDMPIEPLTYEDL